MALYKFRIIIIIIIIITFAYNMWHIAHKIDNILRYASVFVLIWGPIVAVH